MASRIAYHNHDKSAIFLDLLQPEDQRAFCAVGDITFDDRGNAVAAEVVYLDRKLDGTRWFKWDVGHVLHLHPFKFRLDTTNRAGMHIVMEMRGEDGELCYLNNMKVRESGIFVLNPTSTIWPSQKLVKIANGSREELVLSKILSAVYGLEKSLPALCNAQNLPIAAHEDLKHFVHAA